MIEIRPQGNAGGQVGCDYQFNNNRVFGLRAIWDSMNVKGSTSGTVIEPGPGATSGSVGFDTKYFGTAVARAGYLVTPQLMLYGLGGVASVEERYSVFVQWQSCLGTALKVVPAMFLAEDFPGCLVQLGIYLLNMTI